MSYQNHFKKAKAHRKSESISREKLTEDEVEARLREAFKMKSQTRRKGFAQPASSQKIRRSRKAQFPLYSTLSFCMLLAGVSSYLMAPSFYEDLFSHIEIDYMGKARASSEEGKKSPSPKSGEEAKSAAHAEPAKGQKALKKEASVSEDVNYLSKLRERKEALDLRETELNQLEEELHKQKLEVEERIAELSKIREEIKDKLENRVEADEAKVKKLVELYSSMKPKQAAKIIEGIHRELAVDILAGMKKKSAADIMNVMDEKVAKELSERLTGYKRTPAQMN